MTHNVVKPDVQQLLDCVDDYLIAYDLQKQVTASNATLSKAVPVSTYVLPLPNWLGMAGTEWNAALEATHSGTTTQFDMNVQRPDGSPAIIEILCQPMYDAHHNVIGSACRMRDVTHTRSTQYQLEQYALRLNNIVDRYDAIALATNDAVWDWIVNENTIAWNRGIYTNFGHDIRATDIDWWKEHIHQDDYPLVAASLEAWVESGEGTWTSEYRFRCADGSYRWVFNRGLIVSDEGRQRLVGSMIDVNERKATIARLAEQNEQLREIASMTSHQLRGPLTSLMALIHLYDRKQPNNPVNAQVVEFLAEAAQNLDSVIRAIVNQTTSIDSSEASAKNGNVVERSTTP